MLYIVLFLHQTTTYFTYFLINERLYIVLFLHQTTTSSLLFLCLSGLYIVLFLHQTTTDPLQTMLRNSCISYYSYIKPQPAIGAGAGLLVVYRTIPTSNHN